MEPWGGQLRSRAGQRRHPQDVPRPVTDLVALRLYAGEGLSGAIAVNVLKGALRFTTGNAAKHSYLITTPTAAIGVRGTIFRIEATASKTRVVLEEGAIDVCMRNFKQRCVTLDHPGQQATVTTTQVAMTTDPASPSVGGILGVIG